MTREARATWVERVERWKKSGKTADEFAAEIGVNARSLKWWKWMLGSERSSASAKPRAKQRAATPLAKSSAITPITFVEMTSAIATDAIEVVLPTSVRVAVKPGFDEQTLSRVLDVLERRA